MRLDLAVVEDGLLVLELDGIADALDGLENLFDLACLGGGKILGVGTRIGQIAALVQALHDLQALRHRHLVLLAEHVLQLGEGIELARLDLVLLALDRCYHSARRIVRSGGSLGARPLGGRKFLLADKFHHGAVRFDGGAQRIVGLGLEIADGAVAVIDRFDDRHDHAPDAEQLAGLQRGVPREVDAVEPVDIGAGKALVGKAVVFALIFHVGKRRAHGLGCLIRQPEADKALFALQRVHHAEADDDLTLAVRVPRVDDGVHVRAVAEVFQRFILARHPGIDRAVRFLP